MDTWRGVIESLSQEGLGVGSMQEEHDGSRVRRPVFVPFAIPGDLVTASIVERKKKYLFGELTKIIEPSKHRREPHCPHFRTCGGCNLEHVAYEEQLRQKQQQTEFFLKRKQIVLPKPLVITAAPVRSKYRWRSRVAVECTGGKLRAGFRKWRSKDIVPIGTCEIVEPHIMETITLLNKTKSDISGVELEVVIVAGSNGKTALLVVLDTVPPQTRPAVKELFEKLYGANRKLIANLFFQDGRVTKTHGQVQEHITYKAAGFTFSFLPETFIQSNVSGNDVLIRQAMDMLKIDASDKSVAIDLYAGIGNLTLPLAQRCAHVVAVEGHETAVLLARINSYQNNIHNTTIIHRSAEKYAQEYAKRNAAGEYDEEYRSAPICVLDPPRTGCAPQVLHALQKSTFEKILYVSCNPITLAQDLATLTKTYTVTDIAGVDMFPDISHVEILVLLEKK
jgi:23S rRNA (uracil1939-C5)-methyltransferase